MRPPRIAVVGCGQWGRHHVRNFADLEALELVCDRDPQVLAATARRYPGLQVTTDFERVLADETVAGVVLATPAGLHAAQAQAALEAGKDVLVEKPLALSYQDALAAVTVAQAQRRILMVGHVLEYHPAVTLLERLVREGVLGRVWYIYSNRLNLGQVRREENILWSFAPHDISIILNLTGTDPSVVAAYGASYLRAGIADVTVTHLQFEGHLRAHVFVSWLHPYKEQRLVVIGDRKMAVLDDVARDGKLRLYDKGFEWRDGAPVPRQTAETTLFVDEVEPLRLECEAFLKAIVDRSVPKTDGWSALRVLRVLEAAQRSLEQAGVPVRLAPDDALDRVGAPGSLTRPDG